MAMTHEEMVAAAIENLGASVDETGVADLVFEKGQIVVASDPKKFKDAFKRAKKLEGYKWVLLSQDQVFAANRFSIGSKAGMITPEGKILKNSDLPKPKA